jgi:hypothetical protein
MRMANAMVEYAKRKAILHVRGSKSSANKAKLASLQYVKAEEQAKDAQELY